MLKVEKCKYFQGTPAGKLSLHLLVSCHFPESADGGHFVQKTEQQLQLSFTNTLELVHNTLEMVQCGHIKHLCLVLITTVVNNTNSKFRITHQITLNYFAYILMIK
ncbi:hypothetical protein SRHO_G00038420 [Serrasalmus rhombeus]